jgi:predicted HicB family RNase H-like nuclease
MLQPMPRRDEPTEPKTATQLRVETSLWEKAKVQARRRRMSYNAYVCLALENQVAADEATLKQQ